VDGFKSTEEGFNGRGDGIEIDEMRPKKTLAIPVLAVNLPLVC